jgi:succinate dehydrogenase / fumarate reductase flavoprotein subunit
MYHQFKQLANVDITKEAMEVGPTAHYMMGGVRVEPDTGMTTVKGLFAAGEVAAGLHGANRLGGNSLSDLVVFGKIAGEGAANYVKSQKPSGKVNSSDAQQSVQENIAYFERTSGENPYTLHQEIQEMMQNNVGIVRTEAELRHALVELDKFEQRAKNLAVSGSRAYNPGWNLAMDLPSIITMSRAITMAALERKESRGGHARIDYPDYDKNLSKVNFVVKNVNNKMQIESAPLPEPTVELKALIEES